MRVSGDLEEVNIWIWDIVLELADVLMLEVRGGEKIIVKLFTYSDGTTWEKASLGIGEI